MSRDPSTWPESRQLVADCTAEAAAMRAGDITWHELAGRHEHDQAHVRDVISSLLRDYPEWPYASRSGPASDERWQPVWNVVAFVEEWFAHPENTDLEEAVSLVPLDADEITYDIADWHDSIPLEPLLRAHLLRLVKDWGGEKSLCDYFEEHPALAGAFDFAEWSKSTLWRVWNKDRLHDHVKQMFYTMAEAIVNIARENDVPAPEEAFHPDPSVDNPETVEQDDSTVRDRTIAKTRDVWRQAKPMVTENYEIPRGDNTEIHESAFLEAHAFIGSRAEMYAEDGTWNFAVETRRDRVQTGSTHRHHLQKISPDEARRMHRETTKELIERARRDSELVGGLLASIDISKSNPYRENTALEFDENGLANPWLLGYKENDDDEDDLPDLYYQWASIQIVGLDIPLVLDAIPVRRGLSRAAIVDRLLETATDMVDIEMVMMDREFDGDAVKDVCEEHHVWYLNPARMHASERATCTRLRRQGKLVHIERDESGTSEDGGRENPARKRVYVPARNAKLTGDDGDEDSDANEDEADDEDELRNELFSEFAETMDEDVPGDRMFGDLLEEIYEEEAERDLPGDEEDTKLYILFESNHPDLELPDEEGGDEYSEAEKAHMVSRVIRKYGHRWGIENGFKQIKRFRVRTTSMKYEYRFFNFLYACTMYNVWRLVDLLVKLELLAESEIQYKPLVTADLFLTIAKDYAGLDPPD